LSASASGAPPLMPSRRASAAGSHGPSHQVAPVPWQPRRPIEPFRLLRLMEAGLVGQQGAAAGGGAPAAFGAQEAAAGAAVWARLHAGLTRLLAGDAYAAAAAVALRGNHSGQADARDATPPVDADTWEEAARRYLWAAAGALYLSSGEAAARGAPGAPAAAAPDLPGRLSGLAATDWAAALCGGGGSGADGAGGGCLGPLPRGALLPIGASETAAAAAAALEDAAALSAAAELVRSLAGEEPAAAAAPPAEPQQQARRLECRRLLQTLMSCRADKAAGTAAGRAMCFYAAEAGALLRWHKALDLRGVAARLEAGLYDGPDGMEVWGYGGRGGRRRARVW
jgi:hypothetical protein